MEIVVKKEIAYSSRNQHIIIVGCMCVGKSTLTPILAAYLDLSSFDIDEIIDYHVGISGGEIIRTQGMAVFRDIEEKIALDTLSKKDRSVIAIGAGGFISDKFRNKCQSHITVWMIEDRDVLVSRLSASDRFLAKIRPPSLIIDEQLSQRKKYYEESDIWVYCNSESTDIIAKQLARELTKGHI